MKKILITVGIILLAFGALFASWVILEDQVHSGIDRTEVKLQKPIRSVKDGLNVAEERARKWNKNLKISTIHVSLDGKEQIEKRKGIISYWFSADGFGLFRNEMISCRVDVDMEKSAIIEFNAYGQYPRTGWESQDITKCKIDINDVMNIVTDRYGKDVFYKTLSPYVHIAAFEKAWIIYIRDKHDTDKDLEIKIDAATGKILED